MLIEQLYQSYKIGQRPAEAVYLVDNEKVFSGRQGTDPGDVGMAKDLQINYSLRYKNTIRLYDPRIEEEYRGMDHPGEVICENCFESK